MKKKIRLVLFILIILFLSLSIIINYYLYDKYKKEDIGELLDILKEFKPLISDKRYSICKLYNDINNSSRYKIRFYGRISTGFNYNISYKQFDLSIHKNILFEDKYIFRVYYIEEKTYYLIFNIDNIFSFTPYPIYKISNDFIQKANFFYKSKYRFYIYPRIY
ncbi:MAG: hypothetical protein KBB84_02495 [Spirochaetes bacterium]|nr:hypothetical protein [Spirochaetota bacterium]